MNKAFSPGLKRWIKIEEVLSTGAKPTARKQRIKHAFAIVPLESSAEIAKTTRNLTLFIWQWLLYEAWRTKSTTIKMSNGPLKPYNIDRFTKYRTLNAFAQTGAITLHKAGKRAIIVMLNEKFL
jgi:hypothetical protein